MYQSPDIIKTVSEVLRKPIPSINEDIDLAIIESETLLLPLAEATAKHLGLIYEKRKQILWPRDMDTKLTEMDRKIRLNGDMAPLEADKELMLRLEDILKNRLYMLSIMRR